MQKSWEVQKLKLEVEVCLKIFAAYVSVQLSKVRNYGKYYLFSLSIYIYYTSIIYLLQVAVKTKSNNQVESNKYGILYY